MRTLAAQLDPSVKIVYDKPVQYERVSETWLSRPPDSSALLVSLAATLFLAFASAVYGLDLWHAHEWMPASGEKVFAQHETWRLLTTIFAHADLSHLLSNSLLFFILGYFLYGHFGAWLFPTAAVLGGAVANYIVLPTYDPEVFLIGASGVVYWMGGAWLVLYFLLSRQKNFHQRWMRTLGVAILLFMPSEHFEQGVSYRTHLVGFALGTVSGALQYLSHRSQYLAAEKREIIVEEIDPVLDVLTGHAVIETGEEHQS